MDQLILMKELSFLDEKILAFLLGSPSYKMIRVGSDWYCCKPKIYPQALIYIPLSSFKSRHHICQMIHLNNPNASHSPSEEDLSILIWRSSFSLSLIKSLNYHFFIKGMSCLSLSLSNKPCKLELELGLEEERLISKKNIITRWFTCPYGQTGAQQYSSMNTEWLSIRLKDWHGKGYWDYWLKTSNRWTTVQINTNHV